MVEIPGKKVLSVSQLNRMARQLLESDPNRCILCEKCVKVDHEIVGCDAIAVVNKGEATIIDTIDGKPLDFAGVGEQLQR